MNRITQLQEQLNDFDRSRRREALEDLLSLVEQGQVELPADRPWVNLHIHTFYSYNAEGYSPTAAAWRARREGLAVAGIVDFDVLDGVDEFFEAAGRLGLSATAGIETRAYVGAFAEEQINSPGEPGIAYHMGTGIARGRIEDPSAAAFADTLRRNAQHRNRTIAQRVNEHLEAVILDYNADVLPLSPSATPTERHLCKAYQHKAEQIFPDPARRSEFWAEKLALEPDRTRAIIDDPVALQGVIRSRTMKAGGAGYRKPDPESFPRVEEMNRFVRRLGGIPTLAWLDGTREGEADAERLIRTHRDAGVAAVNIIPDRNWNIDDPELRSVKVQKLHEIVRLAERYHMPVLVGTEMNAPGLKFVDDFDAPELAPLVETFLRGAYILRGHTLAMQTDGHGYLSDWALDRFETPEARNDHFYALGRNEKTGGSFS